MPVTKLLVAISLTAGVCLSGFSNALDNGRAEINAGHYSSALKTLLPLANGGDAEAQRLIGEMYYQGQGVKIDKNAAFKWNEASADAGNKIAQYNLGYLYERGDGAPASKKNAIEAYKRAALQGYIPAHIKLGDLYLSSDRELAKYWYKSAMEYGDDEAKKKYDLVSTSDVRASDEYSRQRQAEREVEERRQARIAAQEAKQKHTEMQAEAEQANQNNYQRPQFGLDPSTVQLFQQGNQNRRQIAQNQARPSPQMENYNQPDRASNQNNSTARASADAAESNHREAERAANARAEQAERDRNARAEVDARRQADARNAQRKADEENAKQEELTKRKNYFLAVQRSLKLSARNCPGGAGQHYIVGMMPPVKPQVVDCLNVSYSEICPESSVGSAGTIHAFVGMGTDCFTGDAATVSPTPACKPEQARVTVTSVTSCS